MKKLWIFLVLVLVSPLVHAQLSPFQANCEVGGTSVLVSGLPSTNKVQGSWPGCLVSVYVHGTTTLATIYSSATETALSNPFTANTTTGNFLFFAATNDYDVTISPNPAIPSTATMPVFTFSSVQLGSSGGGSNCIVVGGLETPTIQSAITAAGTTGCVLIPYTYTGIDTYTNPNGVQLTDYRFGTPSVPLAGLSPSRNNLLMFRNDNTTATSTVGDTCCYGEQPSGVGNAAPMVGLHLHSYNSASVMPLYTYSEWEPGATGYQAGTSFNAKADKGSVPQQIFHNMLVDDESGWDVTSCTRTGSTVNCTVDITNAPFIEGIGAGLYISGNTAINTGGGIAIITGVTSNSFTFTQTGANVTGTGGHAGPNHLAWSLEVDGFNKNHDPGPVTAFSGSNVLPFHGITSTGNGIYPLSEAFLADGLYYEGFLSQNAMDADFTAGYPTPGGTQVSQNGFVARPMSIANIAGTNYPSKSLVFTDSTNDATSIDKEENFFINFQPNSSAPDANGSLVFTTQLASGSITDYLAWQLPSGSATLPAYSFNGVSNSGVYLNGTGCVSTSVNGTDREDVCSTGIATPGGLTASALSGTGVSCVQVDASGNFSRYGGSCGGGGGGGGTVTNVTSTGNTFPGLTATITNPMTTPNIAITPTGGLAANLFMATPTSGTGPLSLRAITTADLPASGGTVTASPQFSLPYYSLTGTQSTIAGSATFSLNGNNLVGPSVFPSQGPEISPEAYLGNTYSTDCFGNAGTHTVSDMGDAINCAVRSQGYTTQVGGALYAGYYTGATYTGKGQCVAGSPCYYPYDYFVKPSNGPNVVATPIQMQGPGQLKNADLIPVVNVAQIPNPNGTGGLIANPNAVSGGVWGAPPVTSNCTFTVGTANGSCGQPLSVTVVTTGKSAPAGWYSAPVTGCGASSGTAVQIHIRGQNPLTSANLYDPPKVFPANSNTTLTGTCLASFTVSTGTPLILQVNQDAFLPNMHVGASAGLLQSETLQGVPVPLGATSPVLHASLTGGVVTGLTDTFPVGTGLTTGVYFVWADFQGAAFPTNGPVGSGAVIQENINGGAIQSASVVYGGSGYASGPTFTLPNVLLSIPSVFNIEAYPNSNTSLCGLSSAKSLTNQWITGFRLSSTTFNQISSLTGATCTYGRGLLLANAASGTVTSGPESISVVNGQTFTADLFGVATAPVIQFAHNQYAKSNTEGANIDGGVDNVTIHDDNFRSFYGIDGGLKMQGYDNPRIHFFKMKDTAGSGIVFGGTQATSVFAPNDPTNQSLVRDAKKIDGMEIYYGGLGDAGQAEVEVMTPQQIGHLAGSDTNNIIAFRGNHFDFSNGSAMVIGAYNPYQQAVDSCARYITNANGQMENSWHLLNVPQLPAPYDTVQLQCFSAGMIFENEDLNHSSPGKSLINTFVNNAIDINSGSHQGPAGQIQSVNVSYQSGTQLKYVSYTGSSTAPGLPNDDTLDDLFVAIYQTGLNTGACSAATPAYMWLNPNNSITDAGPTSSLINIPAFPTACASPTVNEAYTMMMGYGGFYYLTNGTDNVAYEKGTLYGDADTNGLYSMGLSPTNTGGQFGFNNGKNHTLLSYAGQDIYAAGSSNGAVIFNAGSNAGGPMVQAVAPLNNAGRVGFGSGTSPETAINTINYVQGVFGLQQNAGNSAFNNLACIYLIGNAAQDCAIGVNGSDLVTMPGYLTVSGQGNFAAAPHTGGVSSVYQLAAGSGMTPATYTGITGTGGGCATAPVVSATVLTATTVTLPLTVTTPGNGCANNAITFVIPTGTSPTFVVNMAPQAQTAGLAVVTDGTVDGYTLGTVASKGANTFTGQQSIGPVGTSVTFTGTTVSGTNTITGVSAPVVTAILAGGEISSTTAGILASPTTIAAGSSGTTINLSANTAGTSGTYTFTVNYDGNIFSLQASEMIAGTATTVNNRLQSKGAATNQPVTITAYSATTTITTLTAANTYAAGNLVLFNVTAGPTYLNGLTATVLSTGLSATQFQVAFVTTAASGAATGTAQQQGGSHVQLTTSDPGGADFSFGGFPILGTVNFSGSVNIASGLAVNGNSSTFLPLSVLDGNTTGGSIPVKFYCNALTAGQTCGANLSGFDGATNDGISSIFTYNGTGAITNTASLGLTGHPTETFDSSSGATFVGAVYETETTASPATAYTITLQPMQTITLTTGNVTLTAPTVPAIVGGPTNSTCITLNIVQSTTARTVTFPATFHGAFTIGTTVSKVNTQPFCYSPSLAYWVATSAGVINQ